MFVLVVFVVFVVLVRASVRRSVGLRLVVSARALRICPWNFFVEKGNFWKKVFCNFFVFWKLQGEGGSHLQPGSLFGHRLSLVFWGLFLCARPLPRTTATAVTAVTAAPSASAVSSAVCVLVPVLVPALVTAALVCAP